MNGFFTITRRFKVFLVVISAISVLLTLVVIGFRFWFPYELEHMEGVTVEHVLRLENGSKVFVPPSIEFIPMIYTPLYYYVGWFFTKFFGIGYQPLRLVSIVSHILSLIFIFKITKQLTNERFFALISIGLFSLSFAVVGRWFDLARVDSLANMFLFASVFFLLSNYKSKYLLFAIFSFLSFYTKQSNLMVTLFLLVPIFIENKKDFWITALVLFLAIGISTLVEGILSDGWYIFWNFYLPAQHHWLLERFFTFWTSDILPYFSIALSFITLWFIDKLKLSWNFSERIIFCFFIGAMINSYLLRLHYGGFLNVIIPFVGSIAILFPYTVFQFLKETRTTSISKQLILVLLVFQFLVLVYNPLQYIPTQKSVVGWNNFIENVKGIKGDVFLPVSSFIPRLAGKKSYAHYVLINDLLISNVKEKGLVYRQLVEKLKKREFSAVILGFDENLPMLEEFYENQSHRTGRHFAVIWRNRYLSLWLPK